MPSPISFKLQNYLFGTPSAHCTNTGLKEKKMSNFWIIAGITKSLKVREMLSMLSLIKEDITFATCSFQNEVGSGNKYFVHS